MSCTNSPELIRAIATHGGNVADELGRTPLMLAKDVTQAQALLPLSNINAQCKEGRTALMYAIMRKDIETAKILLKCNKRIQDNSGKTALTIAVVVLPEIVAELIHCHNIADQKGRTPLMFRSLLSDTPLDILSVADANRKDVFGCNALMYAKNATHVQWLLEHKADPHVKDLSDGRNILMEAALNGAMDVVQLLVNNFPALINQGDKDGCTVLAYADQQTDIMEYLLRNGADPSIQNEEGRTVLSVAAHDPVNPEGVQLLIKYGAQGSMQLWKDPFHRSMVEYFQASAMLPTKSQPALLREDNTCCICTNEMTDWRRVTLVCGHSFHTLCFDSWRKNCPTCRGATIFLL
jgi:ankyrin repeat protein